MAMLHVTAAAAFDGCTLICPQPQLHHHKAYSAWKDHPRSEDVYALMKHEHDRIAFLPEVMTIMHQYGFEAEVM